MKNAIIAAVVAAVVSSGSAVAATHWINGRAIRPHSIPLNRLAHRPSHGPAGAAGAAGPVGPQGPAGAFAINNVTTYIGASVAIAASKSGFASVSCPVGQVAVGGGGEGNGATITDSKPSPSISTAPLAWIIAAKNETTASVNVRAFVICVH